MKVSLNVKALKIPLRSSFKQASFNRVSSESIWVEASSGEFTGFGEGCPRTYVTGENLPESIQWIHNNTKKFTESCFDLKSLKAFVAKHEEELGNHPAAWCAVELALLDLFAREKGESVESLLNMPEVTISSFEYTAVLSDDEPEIFLQKLDRFKKIGFYHYKVKVSGDIKRDKQKFDFIQSKLSDIPHTLRVDANNLWGIDVEVANNYFEALNMQFLGIEEPFATRNFQAISALSKSQNATIILDESGATKADLQQSVEAGANVILNIKVAKAGGILRSLELIDFAKDLNIPIIVGAHVGETSVLTRAGMLVAAYAGESKISHEGGFGEYLLDRDMVEPVLQIGQNGRIDLSKPYSYPSVNGPVTILPQSWGIGWGLRLRDSLTVHSQ